MAERITLKNVKIRVETELGGSEELAGRISDLLESLGYEVIEWSRPFQMHQPDEGRERTFVGAIPKSREEGNDGPKSI